MKDKELMIAKIRKFYKLNSPKVLSAMVSVPREEFIPKKYKELAYVDSSFPIGFDQRISQPFTVAFMTHLLDLKGSESVLEIGTGSGYQAAVLSKLAGYVYSLEIIPELSVRAGKVFKKLGYKNIELGVSSGEWGWEEKAPFDAIMITAGIAGSMPKALMDQLKEGGRLVAPIQSGSDKIMTRFTKGKSSKPKIEMFGKFHFVPFVRESN